MNLKKIRCKICQGLREGVILRSYNLKLCKDCFLNFFEKRVQETIEKFRMFTKKERIGVAISGGKDSVALTKALKNLKYDLFLFHINCQIEKDNYSKECQEIVEDFAKRENLRLKILNFKDEIKISVKLAAKISKKEICGVCGMIKRYLLNREAKECNVIVTGHTLDDEAASLLSSLIFWKEYLYRQWPTLREEGTLKRRVKPLTLISEKETRLYCEILNLPYQKRPCPLRGGTYVFFKKFIHQLEEEMPSSVLNFYKGFLKRKRKMGFSEKHKTLSACERCGYLTVAKICNFCRLKEKIDNFSKKS
jgi:uncharacterized protein (TIGR00269 family)